MAVVDQVFGEEAALVASLPNADVGLSRAHCVLATR